MLISVITLSGKNELINTDYIVRVIPIYHSDNYGDSEWSRIITTNGDVEIILTVNGLYDKIVGLPLPC